MMRKQPEQFDAGVAAGTDDGDFMHGNFLSTA
jgi:hypothetical protein